MDSRGGGLLDARGTGQGSRGRSPLAQTGLDTYLASSRVPSHLVAFTTWHSVAQSCGRCEFACFLIIHGSVGQRVEQRQHVLPRCIAVFSAVSMQDFGLIMYGELNE